MGDASPAGGTYTGFTAPLGTDIPVINAGGDISFFATLSTGDQGVFLYENPENTIVTIALTGTTAPTGGLFSSFAPGASYGTTPVVSDARQVTFWSTLTDAAAQGVFIWDSGTVARVAAGGDAVPGVTGATFTSFGIVPVANVAGQVVFWGTYTPLAGLPVSHKPGRSLRSVRPGQRSNPRDHQVRR